MIINKFLSILDLYIMRKSTYEELSNRSYDKIGKWSSIGTLQLTLKFPERYDEIYEIFSDEESKSTFDWFLKYRVAYAFLGDLSGKIFSPPLIKEKLDEIIKHLKVGKHGNLIKIGGYYLNTEVLPAVQAWVLNQYELIGKCEVSPGSYVIDGGAYKGETSFWFLSKGAEKIYSFEPDSNCFSLLSENIKRNRVPDKIIPIKKALSNKVGIISFIATGVGASKLDAECKSQENIEAVTLDSFVKKEGLPRVDFIKLDVEGAELEVLEGAVESIKKFRPKMAISVYHKPEDIITIPKFILKLIPSAKLYLSHKFYSLYETILFVDPK